MRFLALATTLFFAGQDDLRKVEEKGTFNLYPGRGRCFHQRLLAGGSVEIRIDVKSGAGLDLFLLNSENFVKFTRGEMIQSVLQKEASTAEDMKLDLPGGNWFFIFRGAAGEKGPDIDGDDLVNIWLAKKVGGPWGGTLALLGAIASKPKSTAGMTTRGQYSVAWSYSAEAQKKAEQQEAQVKSDPQKFVTAKAGPLTHFSLPYDTTSLDSIDIENTSDIDIVAVKLKITYWRNEKDIGSRILSLQKARLLPRKERVSGGVKTKEKGQDFFAFSYSAGEVRVPGKADKATVTVLEIKPE